MNPVGTTHTLRVQGMDCAGCAVAVRKALEAVPGVRKADVDFAAGLAAFEGVLKDYPGARKTPDALLKAGYCEYELKQFGPARVHLQRVVDQFPDSPAAAESGLALNVPACAIFLRRFSSGSGFVARYAMTSSRPATVASTLAAPCGAPIMQSISSRTIQKDCATVNFVP